MLKKKVAILILLITILITGNAQSIEKRYATHLGSGGISYFFRPKKLNVITNVDKFIYDATYLVHSDSITINCTLHVKTDGLINGLKLVSGNKNIQGERVAMLYREVTKHGYRIRITSHFLFSDFANCFKEQRPLVFYITSNDGSFSTATYKRGMWEKERRNMSRIINSIY